MLIGANKHRGYWIFFRALEVVGMGGLYYAFVYADWRINVAAVAYFFLVHLSISVGAHRLIAHNSFIATRPLAYALAILFTGAFQGPWAWWCSKHLIHHERDGKEGDPHRPEDGLWYSHGGWVTDARALEMPKSHPRLAARVLVGPYRSVVDLQWRWYWTLSFVMCVVVPVFLGLVLGDLLGGLLVIGAARLLLQYHLTWVVNSICHSFGFRTERSSATNVWLLAIPTVGESLHRNHHESAGSWRLSKHWWEPDLGGLFIRLCFLVGLAKPKGQKT